MSDKILDTLYDDERLIDTPLIDSRIENEHRHRYEAAAKLVKNKRVLDAACGSGYGSDILATNALSVVGIDYSAEVIDYCNFTRKALNLSFFQMSVTAMDFPDDSFDIIVSFETYEHLTADNQICFLKEIKRVLTPDGILIMSSPNRGIWNQLNDGNNEYHLNELTVKELESKLKECFLKVDIYYQDYVPVSIISSGRSERHIKTIYSNNFDVSDSPVYGIALCSDYEIKENFESIYLQNFAQAHIQLNLGVSDAAMYCDRGNGFCEADKLKAPLKYLPDGRIKVTFQLPSNVKALRFDPGERPCYISDLTSSDKMLSYQPENGILLNNTEVLFYAPDPIFLISGKTNYEENERITLAFNYHKFEEKATGFIDEQNALIIKKDKQLMKQKAQFQSLVETIKQNGFSIKEKDEKINILQAQNITYLAEKAQLDMKVEQLESEIGYKKHLVVELAEKNDDLQKVVVEQAKKNDDLQKSYKKSENDKQQILNSRWYRITKPGRVVTLFIRKALGI